MVSSLQESGRVERKAFFQSCQILPAQLMQRELVVQEK